MNRIRLALLMALSSACSDAGEHPPFVGDPPPPEEACELDSKRFPVRCDWRKLPPEHAPRFLEEWDVFAVPENAAWLGVECAEASTVGDPHFGCYVSSTWEDALDYHEFGPVRILEPTADRTDGTPRAVAHRRTDPASPPCEFVVERCAP